MRQHPKWLLATLAAGVVFLPTPRTNATTIFDDGLLHVVNAASDDVEVRDSGGGNSTVLSIVPGADVAAFDDMDAMTDLPEEGRSVGLFDSSVLIFSGGTVQGRIEARDASFSILVGTANAADDVLVTDNATMQISSDAVVGGALQVSGMAHVDFIDGEVDDLVASGDSTVSIFEGFIDDDLEASGNALVKIAPGGRIDDDAFFEGASRLETSGGRFDDELQFFDNTTAYFNGGEVNDDLVVEDNASVVIDDFQVDDNIEAGGNSTTVINGGLISNVEAAGDSLVTINGGTFSPEGGVVGSFGGTVIVNGGVFGTAGGADPVELAATQGKLDFSGATIAGADSGTAPATELAAGVGGEADLSGVEFGDLMVQAAAGSTVDLTDASAANVDINLEGSSALIDMIGADSLDLTAQLNSFALIRAGEFGGGSIQSLTGSRVEIRGFDFFVNGIEVAALPGLFVDGQIPFANGVITGKLTDLQEFEFIFARGFTPGTELVLVQAPEPACVALFVLGLIGLASVRRRV